MTLHFVLEIVTVSFTAIAGIHAWITRRAEGVLLFGSLLLLGTCRENWVVIERLLYHFAPLRLSAGAAPLIAAVIWAYSIYSAVVWSEWMLQRFTGSHDVGNRLGFSLGFVAVFMIALACFYEPFLALAGMARWEAGTRTTGSVPWIALLGYPSLAVAFLWLFSIIRRWLPRPPARVAALSALMPLLGVLHALGLAELKRILGW
jgi:hypothetical protein